MLTDALAAAHSISPAALTAAIARTDARTTVGPIRFNQVTHTATIPYDVAAS